MAAIPGTLQIREQRLCGLHMPIYHHHLENSICNFMMSISSWGVSQTKFAGSRYSKARIRAQ